MITERPASARGHGPAQIAWRQSRHTFSFGGYYDPQWMGFGALRVLNDDRVAAGAGFAPHRHANMEILSYVISGALAHRDSSGASGVIRAGELQWMGAGHGVEHSEFNASDTEPVHFLQIWLQPDQVNAEPGYGLRAASAEDGWQLLASPDGGDGSLAIRQDVRLHRIGLPRGMSASRSLDPARRYWLHVASGEVTVSGRHLVAGDGLGFTAESGPVELTGDAAGPGPADVLWFDLPG